MGQTPAASQPNNNLMTLKLKYIKLTPLFHGTNCVYKLTVQRNLKNIIIRILFKSNGEVIILNHLHQEQQVCCKMLSNSLKSKCEGDLFR